MNSSSDSERSWVKKDCLFCEQEHKYSPNYTCECSKEEWQNQYRAYDLQLSFDASREESIMKSFHQYDFENPLGMLQYKALPRLRFRTDGMLTVGVTPLLKLDNLSDELGVNAFIKSEGHNPSGCFKDRETLMCMLNSRKRNLNRAVIYSSGNAAASAAIFAQKNGLHLITFVAGDTYSEKVDFIRSHGSDVVVVGDEQTNFEMGYRLFARANAMDFFINNGYDNWSVSNPYRVQGDKTIAVEIIKQLSEDGNIEAPDYVLAPTANGSCLAGIWKGFKELKSLGIITKLPKMVSAGIKNGNPVYKAVQEGQLEKPVKCDLELVAHDDARMGSIILAEEGYDSIAAARAVVESDGLAIEVTTADIEEMYHFFLEKEKQLARDENIMPEPASLISLAAIDKIKEQGLLSEGQNVVSVITGSGFKARKRINEIMEDDPANLKMVNRILDRKKAEQYPDARKQGQRLNVEPNLDAVTKAFDQLKNCS